MIIPWICVCFCFLYNLTEAIILVLISLSLGALQGRHLHNLWVRKHKQSEVSLAKISLYQTAFILFYPIFTDKTI